MKIPAKALILAAGFGTRIRPLSFQTPKPLLPLWGKPILDHTLETLARWGVRDVLINLHHSASAMFDHVLRNKPAGMRIEFSYEPAILGTGGALRKAAWFLDDACFWIVNGDIAFDIDSVPFITTFETRKPLSVLWMTDAAGPRTVEMSDGVVTSFNSSHSEDAGTYTFCGVHLVSPRILEYFPNEDFFSIIEVYERAMKDGCVVRGICARKSFWSDIGTLARYVETHGRVQEAFKKRLPGRHLFQPEQRERLASFRKSGVVIRGFASFGQNIHVADNTVIENSVIWDDAGIAPGSFVKDSVVADGVCVHGKINETAAVRSDVFGDTQLQAAVRLLGWRPARTAALPLAARGSARTFTRIQYKGRTAMVIQYSLERPENALYSQNAALLKRIGVRVPKIILDLPDRRLLVMEDVGDCALLDLVRSEPPEKTAKLYRAILESVAVIHKHGRQKAQRSHIVLSEPFSETLYRWERKLFAGHFLDNRLHLPSKMIAKVMRDMELVARRLMNEPLVLLHRDLQSTNVLFHHGLPVFIDFQGMRYGPAMYDVASLLCDPYVSLSSAMQNELLSFYAERMRLKIDAAAESFRWAAVERLVQAIGAYGRLGSLPETAHFNRHILPGLRMLNRVLAGLDNLSQLKRVVCYALEKRKGYEI